MTRKSDYPVFQGLWLNRSAYS